MCRSLEKVEPEAVVVLESNEGTQRERGGAERGTRRRIGCASTRGAAWPAAGAHCAMRHTHGGALPKQLKCTVVMLEK